MVEVYLGPLFITTFALPTAVCPTGELGLFGPEMANATVRALTLTHGSAGISLRRPATASSAASAGTAASMAVDGNPYSRWTAMTAGHEWLAVDLGTAVTITNARLYWDNATSRFAEHYTLSTSHDGSSWAVVYTETAGNGGFDEFSFPAGTRGRHLRLDCLRPGVPHHARPKPQPLPMVQGMLYNDSDISPPNLGGFNAADWQTCKGLCEAHNASGCTAFIFDERGAASCADGKCCWLKACASCERVPSPGWSNTPT
jgi:hypothetical protein